MWLFRSQRVKRMIKKANTWGPYWIRTMVGVGKFIIGPPKCGPRLDINQSCMWYKHIGPKYTKVVAQGRGLPNFRWFMSHLTRVVHTLRGACFMWHLKQHLKMLIFGGTASLELCPLWVKSSTFIGGIADIFNFGLLFRVVVFYEYSTILLSLSNF